MNLRARQLLFGAGLKHQPEIAVMICPSLPVHMQHISESGSSALHT
jgi:hypothetical protein